MAGLGEAKVEIREFVEFLHHPARFQALGAVVPKGALLVGPPGTGKTLLAKAVAGEAKVPFFAVAGSDFVEMFVGVGAARVRDLFRQAREAAPCIIYIDEIDAVGRKRAGTGGGGGSGGGMGGSNSERETTLNQLLVELDGFAATAGIVVLASTNRADILDQALLRPGRFDRQISCDLPTRLERADLFRVHMRPLRVLDDPTKYLDELALQTAGLAGAQIASVCNEAALRAARAHHAGVTRDDFLAALDRVLFGLEKKDRVVAVADRRLLAVHEAGHAVLAWLLPHATPPARATMLPQGRTVDSGGGGSAGRTVAVAEERHLHTTAQLRARLAVMLAGRAAETLLSETSTTGSEDDLRRGTDLARRLVTQFGMSPRVGLLTPDLGDRDPYGRRPVSNALAQLVDEEVAAEVAAAFARAREVLGGRLADLRAVADALEQHETLDAAALQAILGPRLAAAGLAVAGVFDSNDEAEVREIEPANGSDDRRSARPSQT